mgnify:CR=1 FL=1
MAYLSRQCVDCQENTKRCEANSGERMRRGSLFPVPCTTVTTVSAESTRERERGERYLQGDGAYADEHRRRAAKRRSARQR